MRLAVLIILFFPLSVVLVSCQSHCYTDVSLLIVQVFISVLWLSDSSSALEMLKSGPQL